MPGWYTGVGAQIHPLVIGDANNDVQGESFVVVLSHLVFGALWRASSSAPLHNSRLCWVCRLWLYLCCARSQAVILFCSGCGLTGFEAESSRGSTVLL